MNATKVLEQVDEAIRSGSLVRVVRSRGWERLDGTLLARSPKWLLMARGDSGELGGHSAIRLTHVRRLELEWSSSSFTERALVADGTWPLPGLAGVDLSSTRSMVQTIGATAPMVAVHYEQDHPDECLIGVPRDLRRRRFRLQEINPNAQWDGNDTVFRHRSVSRIDVGGAYEVRLARVGGPAPAEA